MQISSSRLKRIASATALAITACAAQAGTQPLQGSLNFTEYNLGGFDVARISVTPLGAGVSTPIHPEYEMPGGVAGLSLVSVVADGTTRDVKSLHFGGGFRLDAAARLPSGRRNAASTGGWMEISGLKIDYVNGSITGSVTGANGVGSATDIALWRFDTNGGLPKGIYDPGITFQEHQSVGCNGPEMSACVYTISLTGLQPSNTGPLTLTAQGFDVMASSLGLTRALGQPVLREMGRDFGSFSVTAVPEPSAWAMLTAGLACVGMTTLRRRKPASAEAAQAA